MLVVGLLAILATYKKSRSLILIVEFINMVKPARKCGALFALQQCLSL